MSCTFPHRRLAPPQTSTPFKMAALSDSQMQHQVMRHAAWLSMLARKGRGFKCGGSLRMVQAARLRAAVAWGLALVPAGLQGRAVPKVPCVQRRRGAQHCSARVVRRVCEGQASLLG